LRTPQVQVLAPDCSHPVLRVGFESRCITLPAQEIVAAWNLDAGYDYQPCRQVLSERGMAGQIATRGVPAPIQADRRWVIERTHAWGNQYGKLRWCTERRWLVVQFWLALVNAAHLGELPLMPLPERLVG
jgi:hypothetical protein